MNVIEQAEKVLRDALRAVDGARLHPDVGAGVSPPALVVGVPSLTWEGMCAGPTSARWLVYVVVPADNARAAGRLMELVLRVAAALDAVDDAVVVRADPGTYPASGGDLPAYEIQVDMALGA
ncbi:hypothetical protein ACIA59_10620 [Micromonospora haikouensis]|uniref:hypothetical protein n=1 Tax=Micromonospora haikouensis TaxID=686309 RepID=UPI003788846E